jgi:TPR repeat protein
VSVEYLRKSARQGEYLYGFCHETSRGFKKDYEIAAKYYKGNEGGNLKGYDSYGHLERKGLGICKNVAEGFRYCKMSADSGNIVGLKFS